MDGVFFFFFSPVSPSHKAYMKVEWKTKGSEAIEIVATESPRPVIGHVSVKIIAYKIHTFQFNLCNLCGSIWFGFFGVSGFTFRDRKGNAKKNHHTENDCVACPICMLVLTFCRAPNKGVIVHEIFKIYCTQ